MTDHATKHRVPLVDDGDVQFYHGDALDVLRSLPAGIAQTCVTSPPYWGLRDYGTVGQLGLEATPDEYVSNMVALFAEVRRVLRDDGTLWVNLGDSYHGGGGGNYGDSKSTRTHAEHLTNVRNRIDLPGLKPKDLVGIPWRVAFALQQDGWYLRSDIIWSKPNPMPESVTDRPTKAHEYLFLLSKRPRYFYDADAIREPLEPITLRTHGTRRVESARSVPDRKDSKAGSGKIASFGLNDGDLTRGSNRRSVWMVATEPFPDAHFATFPQALVEPCIKAGSREGDVVLDPFIGSGTTALVARRHGRRCIGIDLNSEYLAIAAKRTQQLSLLGGAA